MGVLCITCTATGDRFLFISRDASNGFNVHTFQLEANLHRNKELQKLWNEHGETAFTFEVAGLIEYDDPQEDQREKLEALLEKCLADLPQARKI